MQFKIIAMSKEHTDVELLRKGVKYLAIALPLLFLSPYLITLAFLNTETIYGYVFFRHWFYSWRWCCISFI